MMVIQRVLQANLKRTYASTRIAGKEIGFGIGEHVNVLQRGDTLLYTKSPEYFDFEYVKSAKAYNQNDRPQITIQESWLKDHPCEYLRVYYTNHGLFLRPFYLEDFDQINLFDSGRRKKRKSKTEDLITDILNIFNEVKKGYSPGTRGYNVQDKHYRELLKARMKEDYSLEDFNSVIRYKAHEWNGGGSWGLFRPGYIFSEEHFDCFYDELQSDINKSE
jgi:uncharacterized phage protein (TIGR02220 family)